MRITKSRLFGSIALLFATQSSLAAIPAGYYQTVDTSGSVVLKQSLHNIIKDHNRIPYTSTSTDTWDVLEQADQDPDAPQNVIDVYKNASYPKAGGGNTNYNREHSWPKSYGFPADGSSNYPYTDMHHLFIADSGYNSSRNNKPYANCDPAVCIEKPTQLNNGRGGSATDISLTTGSGATGSWQTWPGRKGDVARALMYMAVRYEGGVHSVSGAQEPDLILTDDRALIEASNTGGNETTAYMGLKSILLSWHHADPVDDFERRHNDAVYQYQGNRNPFVDHPEYVDCVFENTCNGQTVDMAPATPGGFNASGGDGQVQLSWAANGESDLAAYRVYRAEGGSYTLLSDTTATSFTDVNVTNGTAYQYTLSAYDMAGNESTQTTPVTVTPGVAPATPWINEIHYDNDGTDTAEGIEIAGTAGTDLTGWQLIGYNGNGGTAYVTVSLSGVIADQQGGFGTVFFAISGLQNGAPDGLALVSNTGEVIQFLSYEGTLIATDGAAAGMTSTDIGIAETSTSALGTSLQLIGTGQSYADFTWQSQNASYDAVNPGQSFSGSGTGTGTPQPVYYENTTALAIADTATVTSALDVALSGISGDMTVNVNISHSYRGDISVDLKAPDGSLYSLKVKDKQDSAADVVASYTLNAAVSATGTWQLIVTDNFKRDTGTLNGWSITFNR